MDKTMICKVGDLVRITADEKQARNDIDALNGITKFAPSMSAYLGTLGRVIRNHSDYCSVWSKNTSWPRVPSGQVPATTWRWAKNSLSKVDWEFRVGDEVLVVNEIEYVKQRVIWVGQMENFLGSMFKITNFVSPRKIWLGGFFWPIEALIPEELIPLSKKTEGLDCLLEALWDAQKSRDREAIGSLLARYKALTGRDRPAFMR